MDVDQNNNTVSHLANVIVIGEFSSVQDSLGQVGFNGVIKLPKNVSTEI